MIQGRHWGERSDRVGGVQHHAGDRGLRPGGRDRPLSQLVFRCQRLHVLPHMHHRFVVHHRQRPRFLV